ncbi:glycosyltransferase [Patescibacteria group bacterium]|nr:glycosyltransferase [Patescibacteria group bacterium]
MIELKNKKIVIATHVYTTGPAQDLKEYLLNNKIKKLLFIGHPLFFNKKLKGSGYEIYKDGKLVEENYKKIKKIIEPISYVKDIILNIVWCYKYDKKWDLYVGSDNLNAFSGVVLKWLGKVDKVVYYVIDYNPKRFNNNLFNKAYHFIDQFCVRYCDETWNVSPRMEPARKKYFNFSGGRQKVVPIGIWFERIKRLEYSEIEKHTLVFMGHVLEKQGVQYVLDAIPIIAKKISDFKFIVIGGGNYIDILKEKVKSLDIEKFVYFTGYVEKHEDIENLLARCAVAVALYEEKDENGNLSFSYFADPAKLKSYLASGLPVLLSDVPYNAKELENNKCGIIIDYDKDEIANAIVDLMRDENKLKEYRGNAINYAKQFDWDDIFKNVFNTYGDRKP